jgi:hypothetical protein
MTHAQREEAIEKLGKAAGLFLDDRETEMVLDLPSGILDADSDLRRARDIGTAKAKAKVRMAMWNKAMTENDSSALRMVWQAAEKFCFDVGEEN